MKKITELIRMFRRYILHKCSDWKLKRIIKWEIKNKGGVWYGKCKSK